MPLQAATTPAADVVFIMEAAQVTPSSSLRPQHHLDMPAELHSSDGSAYNLLNTAASV